MSDEARGAETDAEKCLFRENVEAQAKWDRAFGDVDRARAALVSAQNALVRAERDADAAEVFADQTKNALAVLLARRVL